MSLEPNDPNVMGPSLTLPPTTVEEHAAPSTHDPHKSWKASQEEQGVDEEGQDQDEMNEAGKDGDVSTKHEAGAATEEGSDEEEEVSEGNFWQTADVEMLQNDNDSEEKLTVLGEGTKRREQVNKALAKTHDESKVGMEAILHENITQSITEALQQDFTSIFGKLNVQLMKTFQENTERRRGMQKRLEEYDKHWKRQYRKLASCIQDVDEDPEEDDEKTNSVKGESDKSTRLDETVGANPSRISKEDASPSKDSEASSDEPDWDSLLNQDHAPTVYRIQRYLETRDRLQAAEDQFVASCDEILGKIAVTTKDLLEIAVDVCDPFHEALDLEEQELQKYLVGNFKRRQDLAEALVAVSKQSQRHCALLLASVKNIKGGPKRKRGTAYSSA